MKPSIRKLTALAAVSVMALSGAGMAQARQGADDPAGHHKAETHHRHHHHHHHHVRGNDDGPNHR
jgi:Ni/Co efflux regulator RcnB